MKAFFEGLPEELFESARIDGANDIVILYRIIVPLSLPILATVALWTAVGHWNAWFDAMLFIRDRAGYPLQLILREILIQNDTTAMTAGIDDDYLIGETIQYATIVVATVPILAIYPFVQRYFVKGVMIGAVKG